MKTIKMHGVLEQFGKEFQLDVLSAREATHAIASQLPEFKKFMLQAEQNGMRFAVFLDEQTKENNVGEKDIDNLTSASVIHIVPKIMGAGGNSMGILQVIGGAILIGAGLTGWGFLGMSAMSTLGIGVGLMVGGAASLLMPMPDMPSMDEDGNRANYGFGGAVTTTAQNNPVPILIGDRHVGGFIGSAGIYTEDTQ